MIDWSAFPNRLPLAVILVATLTAAACADGGDGGETLDVDSTQRSASTADGTGTEEAETGETGTVIEGTDGLFVLPVRPGPREETTHGVPHIQIDAKLVPEIDAELKRRVFSLPGVEERESELSLPGARSLWLADDIELAKPEVLQSGREFAHIHPDGSLHVWLPVDRAFEVAETKWGELHPWVGRDDFWDGLVMVYTPETLEELDVTVRLIVDAYNHVTGADIDPETV